MTRVSLDGDKIGSVEELHAAIRTAFEFPEHYGGNLDALWDCLTDYVDGPVTVEWSSFEKCKSSLGDYVDNVVTVFRDAEDEIDGFSLVLD